jgi:hypothetical protein
MTLERFPLFGKLYIFKAGSKTCVSRTDTRRIIDQFPVSGMGTIRQPLPDQENLRNVRFTGMRA